MITVTKRFHWEAAHRLPQHNGKCRNLHGHSYVIEVTVTGLVENKLCSSYGMIIDFEILSKFVEESTSFDHTYLNDLIPYPTAEHIVQWIGRNLLEAKTKKPQFSFTFVKVRLYETEDSYAEWAP